ncbi:MAG: 4Fe-4S binding protein, partial [Betaproteobacteria bacterium]|nr:4Fe-4S binding protein [Betaproteobacteria bacterium]
ASHETIYPRSVSGLFSRWRWAMVVLTQLVFYGLPWLEWGQRQAVLFDLGARRFYIFGLVLYPQDFIYLTGLLVISALSLFLFTAVAGRLWCGYACPQTVYTEIFLWIEKQVEGDRSARMRRDAQPLSLVWLWRKSAKHGLWLAVALWTGFTFVGYFTPVRELGRELMQASLSAWELFWTLFYGFATFDRDTLIVTYDQARGEPRGGRSRKADPAALRLGACVDCSLCVQVCPTGIDIRQGLQYECIGCGACADVCDTVMDKMGYSRGLVKYTTENAMSLGWTRAQTLHHVLRPRILVYASVLGTIVVAMLVSLSLRTPFKVDVVHDRGVAARIVGADQIENVYRMQLMNATESAQHYKLSVKGLPGLAISSEPLVSVAATQSRWVAVRVQLPPENAVPGSHPIRFEIDSLDAEGHLSERSVFLVPQP